MSDFSVRLPWLTRRRPFIAFHIAPFPAYEMRNGRTRKVYHCGIIWGRQFMPTRSGGAYWFDVKFPWKKPVPQHHESKEQR